jgi:hypothetical protein
LRSPASLKLEFSRSSLMLFLLCLPFLLHEGKKHDSRQTRSWTFSPR